MKNLALQRIREMKSYNPPLSGRRSFGGLLLDFNERTIPPSANIQKSIQNFLKTNTLQLYPEYVALEEKLAEYARANADQIMVTNGSDQAIDLIFRTFTQTGDMVIIPTPSFAMFYQCAQTIGNKILRPLYKKKNLSFPLEELLSMINTSVKFIVVCNPNNPTGTLVSIDTIEKIAQKAKNAIVLVDEAYFEFSSTTAVPLIKKYPNIIVTRTFSKAFGLPSLRLGYIVASKICIKELLKVRSPYDIDMITYIAGTAALDLNDVKNTQAYVNQVMNKAKPMVEEFFSKNQIPFYKSAANFILFKPQKASFIEKTLRENGVLIRPQNKTNIENTLRLTIGTVKQMKQFIKIYKNILPNKSKSKKYAFLDRDGTLIFEPQDTFQVDGIEKLKILDGTIKGLKELKKLGYKLIMVSNQNGIGTSSFPKDNFDEPQNKMLSIFKENGITFAKIFVCPHLPLDNCNCRKPKTGLVKKFFRENQIDKNNSLVCGDRTTDKLFAKNIEVKFIPMQTNGNFLKALAEGDILRKKVIKT